MKFEFSPLALARHHELTQHICKEIQISPHARITFARFMELALYAPNLGYYTAKEKILGKQGDFITAPEISPLFGRCVARYCRPILAGLKESVLLEIGAGTGVMAAEILMELERLNCLPTYYWILEISPALKKRQRQVLQEKVPHLLDRIQYIDQLPILSIEGVILANEVLDALPVHLFQSQTADIQERYVAWNGQRFVWQLGVPSSRLLQNSLQKEVLPYIQYLPFYQSELSLETPRWLSQLIQWLKRGVILLIDYGLPASSYYHSERNEGNLKCYCQHQMSNDPLSLVGLQDITSHVNFTQIARVAGQQAAYVVGFSSQAAFLLSCGLLELAQACYSGLPSMEVRRQIHWLVSPNVMGEQCKIMVLSKDIQEVTLLSLEEFDRRGSL